MERASFEDIQGAGFSKDLCEWERMPHPCILVIFGASGDLTARKLVPALYRLFSAGELPTPFCILGTGRTALTDTAFRSKMNQALAEAGTGLGKWDDFEPLWNRNFIDHIRINASETLGVENRAGYYDRAGVLRDMFQNHMLELLALVAGEPPAVFTADSVREKKAELFRCLRPYEPDLIDETLSLGQYTESEIDGKSVSGYREEPGVAPDSLTPTYALLKVFVDNWRWQGVPFFITSGKRLKRKVTRIDIQFKQVPHSMFRNILGSEIGANRLVISIYPEETIFLNFQAMKPGTKFCLRTAGLTFSFNRGQRGTRPDAYQRALLDVMVGDQTLFWDQEGLELCWKFVDPIITTSEAREDRSRFLHSYPAGSMGTDAAINMLPHGSWPEKP